jgi:polyisoprenoid-binding protein YceI
MRSSVIALAAAALLSSGLAHAEPATYAIDPTHTFATFEIGHFGASTNRGRFDKKAGSVTLDKAAKTGKVEITIDTTSINSGTAAFDKHPTMSFVGDKFTFDGDKVMAVAGTLTLLGKTAPVTLKASQFACYQNPMLKREVCGGDFETTVDRTVFGMNYGVDWGFPKNVRVVVQVEAVKQ